MNEYPEWAQYILVFGPIMLAVLSWAWVTDRKIKKDDDDKRNK